MEEGKGIGAGYIALIVVGVLVIVGAVAGLWYMDKQAAPEREAYAGLAACLSDRDVTFYSAFWCPNCAAQKALFKGFAKKLPHRECSLPDRTQNEFCESAGIANYPTWEFNGDLRCVGVVAPEVLAHLAGCPLPAYGDVSYTAQGLYEQLIVEGTTDRLKLLGASAEQIDESLEELRTELDTYLAEQYQITLDELDNVDHMLSAIAEVVYSCEPYSVSEDEEDISGDIVEEGVAEESAETDA